MSAFRKLDDGMFASPQISADDIAVAKEAGISLIINNRPDGEEAGQPEGSDLEQAARAAGIAYRAIPVTSAGFSQPQVAAMAEALDSADGPVLAFCRSGTRSTFLWAMAQAKAGKDLGQIAEAARQAGYDVSPVYPTMDMLSKQSGG